MQKSFTKSLGNIFKETVFIIVVSFLLFLLIYNFIMEPDKIAGVSMEPRFKDGDILLTDKLFYKKTGLSRGNIIVFKSPTDNKAVFIKRIVALPNESIKLKDNALYIINTENPNGFILEEPYLRKNTKTYSGSFLEENKEVKIPENSYFVLGDNRPKSIDSREWGLLPAKNVIGKVVFKHWPPNEFGVIN